MTDKNKKIEALWKNIENASLNESKLRAPLSAEEEKDLAHINELNLHSSFFNTNKEQKKTIKKSSESKILSFWKSGYSKFSYPFSGLAIAASLAIGIFIGNSNILLYDEYNNKEILVEVNKDNIDKEIDNFVNVSRSSVKMIEESFLMIIVNSMEPGDIKKIKMSNEVDFILSLEKESFENKDNCHILNLSFSNIKIDNIEMLACKHFSDLGFIWKLYNSK